MQDKKSSGPSAQSVIITGAAASDRRTYIDAHLADEHIESYNRIELFPGGVSIGIAQVRQFIRHIHRSPYTGHAHAGIIYDAATLTPEAQNALLKTLEEPPRAAVIFLETDQASQLLPTVLSRCQIIALGATDVYSLRERAGWLSGWEILTKKGIGERLGDVDQLVQNRDSALVWVTGGIYALQRRLHEKSQTPRASALTIRKLLRGREQLSANVTPKLVIDSILFENTV